MGRLCLTILFVWLCVVFGASPRNAPSHRLGSKITPQTGLLQSNDKLQFRQRVHPVLTDSEQCQNLQGEILARCGADMGILVAIERAVSQATYALDASQLYLLKEAIQEDYRAVNEKYAYAVARTAATYEPFVKISRLLLQLVIQTYDWVERREIWFVKGISVDPLLTEYVTSPKFTSEASPDVHQLAIAGDIGTIKREKLLMIARNGNLRVVLTTLLKLVYQDRNNYGVFTLFEKVHRSFQDPKNFTAYQNARNLRQKITWASIGERDDSKFATETKAARVAMGYTEDFFAHLGLTKERLAERAARDDACIRCEATTHRKWSYPESVARLAVLGQSHRNAKTTPMIYTTSVVPPLSREEYEYLFPQQPATTPKPKFPFLSRKAPPTPAPAPATAEELMQTFINETSLAPRAIPWRGADGVAHGGHYDTWAGKSGFHPLGGVDVKADLIMQVAHMFGFDMHQKLWLRMAIFAWQQQAFEHSLFEVFSSVDASYGIPWQSFFSQSNTWDQVWDYLLVSPSGSPRANGPVDAGQELFLAKMKADHSGIISCFPQKNPATGVTPPHPALSSAHIARRAAQVWTTQPSSSPAPTPLPNTDTRACKEIDNENIPYSFFPPDSDNRKALDNQYNYLHIYGFNPYRKPTGGLSTVAEFVFVEGDVYIRYLETLDKPLDKLYDFTQIRPHVYKHNVWSHAKIKDPIMYTHEKHKDFRCFDFQKSGTVSFSYGYCLPVADTSNMKSVARAFEVAFGAATYQFKNKGKDVTCKSHFDVWANGFPKSADTYKPHPNRGGIDMGSTAPQITNSDEFKWLCALDPKTLPAHLHRAINFIQVAANCANDPSRTDSDKTRICVSIGLHAHPLTLNGLDSQTYLSTYSGTVFFWQTWAYTTAVALYTGEPLYKQFWYDAWLSEPASPWREAAIFYLFNALVDQATRSWLPAYSGAAYSGIGNNYMFIDPEMDQPVKKGFMSTSTELKVARSFNNQRKKSPDYDAVSMMAIVASSEQGRFVGDFGVFNWQENEVLMPPAKYKVAKRSSWRCAGATGDWDDPKDFPGGPAPYGPYVEVVIKFDGFETAGYSALSTVDVSRIPLFRHGFMKV